ncbi:hypothetical protein SAMN05428938_7992 [Streptomyces sp. KS_5]|nr:hypothetical protein SAMN05428938_7992 [Streptomyces sp. KS_5]
MVTSAATRSWHHIGREQVITFFPVEIEVKKAVRCCSRPPTGPRFARQTANPSLPPGLEATAGDEAIRSVVAGGQHITDHRCEKGTLPNELRGVQERNSRSNGCLLNSKVRSVEESRDGLEEAGTQCPDLDGLQMLLQAKPHACLCLAVDLSGDRRHPVQQGGAQRKGSATTVSHDGVRARVAEDLRHIYSRRHGRRVDRVLVMHRIVEVPQGPGLRADVIRQQPGQQSRRSGGRPTGMFERSPVGSRQQIPRVWQQTVNVRDRHAPSMAVAPPPARATSCA